MTPPSFELRQRGTELSHLINKTVCTNREAMIEDVESSFNQLIDLLMLRHDKGQAIYVVGNGGSAAVASHAITDFVNACQLRAFTLHESSLMTCMANDYGYAHAYQKILGTVFKADDVLIVISSSGNSANMVNAAIAARALGGTVVTLSGFKSANSLRTQGDFNFWLDSMDYGLVEIGHLFLLHNLADRIARTKHSVLLAENAGA